MHVVPKLVTLALTGASGAQYGLRLLQCLLQAEIRVQLLMSNAARVVIATETDWGELPEAPDALEAALLEKIGHTGQSRSGETLLRAYSKEDWFSPVASGTGEFAPMVICPASGGSLSAIATGASNNLIERAADVTLKERRPLILVPREAPYSEIHLENMLKLTRMGAMILPASPGFYQSPKKIEDLIDFIVARILDQLNVKQTLLPQWG